jgi:hypothetical protein
VALSFVQGKTECVGRGLRRGSCSSSRFESHREDQPANKTTPACLPAGAGPRGRNHSITTRSRGTRPVGERCGAARGGRGRTAVPRRRGVGAGARGLALGKSGPRRGAVQRPMLNLYQTSTLEKEHARPVNRPLHNPNRTRLSLSPGLDNSTGNSTGTRQATRQDSS